MPKISYVRSVGLTHTHSFYQAWVQLRYRCTNARHSANYGNAGIGYVSAWNTFKNFYQDMFSTWQPGLTLERKDNNDWYCKENCVWATRKQQARNRSNTALCEGSVDRIKDLHRAGHSNSAITNYLGLARHLVKDVTSGRAWA